MTILCAKCNKPKTEEDKNLYNKICGVEFGVCRNCWNGKFEMGDKK